MIIAALTGFATLTGCTAIDTTGSLTGRSPLRPAKPSSDAATLDIYWAQLPTNVSADQLDSFWSQVQEDRVPVATRQHLLKNGLRAGVVGGTLPDELLQWLNPKGITSADSMKPDGTLVASLEETGVKRRTVQLRPGKQIDLQAGDVLPEAPLLMVEQGELTCRTFNDAQPTYTLQLVGNQRPAGLEPLPAALVGETAFKSPDHDQRITVRLTPEMRFGQQRLRFASDETGMISRGAMTRDAEVFNDLAIAVPLAAGETLVVTALPNAAGRLGGYFHAAGEASETGQKAILIRLAQTPRDDAF